MKIYRGKNAPKLLNVLFEIFPSKLEISTNLGS